MTAQAGRKLVLNMGDGASPTESFTVMGGVQRVNLELVQPLYDATHAAGNAWRVLASDAGARTLRIDAEGVFEDSATEETLRAHAFAGSAANYRVQFGNGDSLAGSFVVERFVRRGDVGELQSFAVSLRSTGALTFVAG